MSCHRKYVNVGCNGFRLQHLRCFYCQDFMRQVVILLLFTESFVASAQKIDKWQISFQLQPEVTFHKNQYSLRWKDTYTKNSFNIGFTSLIQHNLSNRIFFEGGLGYISRKLDCKVFVNHKLYPSPYTSANLFLYTTSKVSQRIIQVPIGIGLYLLRANKLKAFIKGAFISNFLLNVEYEDRYPGFKKNYWLGYSINPAAGIDYRLSTKTVIIGSISYSVVNAVVKDPYLFSQDENPISVPHTYLQLSLGIKMSLQ